MAARNSDSMGNAQGEFHASKPRDEPETKHGHQPGKLVGNDAAPTFSAKTLPPGSAPASRTFEPDVKSEIPGQADNPYTDRSHGKESTRTTAESTLGGATSSDVHTGLGKPMQGQSSSEMRDGSKQSGGLVGVGSSGAASGNQMVDERVQPGQRGLEKEGANVSGTKGKEAGVTDVGADELPNGSA
ncbi:MAG: hypothetical protein Q9220_004342 [cf. Caloplaca sp. 1 TL-2023]